ncbi:MAG: hypothetical protein WBA76_06445 [Phormidesmis sp.]
MSTLLPQVAFASTLPPAHRSVAPAEPVRHTLCGSLSAVQATIKLLYKLNYAEPNDWSQPQPTGRHNEVISVLTRRVSVG